MSKKTYAELEYEKYTALAIYGRHMTKRESVLYYDIYTMRLVTSQESVKTRIVGSCKSCGAPDDGEDDCSYCKTPRIK